MLPLSFHVLTNMLCLAQTVVVGLTEIWHKNSIGFANQYLILPLYRIFFLLQLWYFFCLRLTCTTYRLISLMSGTTSKFTNAPVIYPFFLNLYIKLVQMKLLSFHDVPIKTGQPPSSSNCLIIIVLFILLCSKRG